MITIRNYLNVETMLLTWQSSRDRSQRYFVGIVKKQGNGSYSFRYLTETKEFQKALDNGFAGYPAFKISEQEYTNDVLTSFRKRLPPKSRRDFSKYLEQHNLLSDFSGDDFQLMSHTGIQLPSDGFDLIPDLSEANIPFDYIMEVAGTRYQMTFDEVSEIPIGEEVELRCEDENSYDCNAVAIYLEEKKIGFINRLLCCSIRTLISTKSLTCRVAKKSGTQERPLIYIIISAR